MGLLSRKLPIYYAECMRADEGCTDCFAAHFVVRICCKVKVPRRSHTSLKRLKLGPIAPHCGVSIGAQYFFIFFSSTDCDKPSPSAIVG